jgi:hypothetical protein
MFSKVLRRSIAQSSHCGGHLCMAAWDGAASSKGWSLSREIEVLPASSVMGDMGFCWRLSVLSHPVLPAPGVWAMAWWCVLWSLSCWDAPGDLTVPNRRESRWDVYGR